MSLTRKLGFACAIGLAGLVSGCAATQPKQTGPMVIMPKSESKYNVGFTIAYEEGGVKKYAVKKRFELVDSEGNTVVYVMWEENNVVDCKPTKIRYSDIEDPEFSPDDLIRNGARTFPNGYKCIPRAVPKPKADEIDIPEDAPIEEPR